MQEKLNHKLILDKLLELSKIIDKVLIKNFQHLQKEQIFYKDLGREIFTSIDLEVESIIKNNLFKNFPKAKFISEESFDPKDLLEEEKEELIFIIDPIDGTSNFVNGLEFFCTSIGVMSMGKIIGGLISAPLLKKTFYGIQEIGSFLLNSKTGEISKLEYNEILNKPKNQSKELLSCSSRAVNSANKKISFRILGSIALSISYCSNLTFDGFICPSCKIWDFAGGIGILKSMNFPVYTKEIKKEKRIFQVAAHQTKEGLQKLVESFHEI